MRLKRYKKKKFSRYISRGIIIIIISLVCSFFIIDYFAEKSNEILLPMAESKTRKVVAMVINSATDDVVISNDLYVINKNSDDVINMVSYNSFEATKLINEITRNIEEMIMDVENGELDYYGNKNNIEGGVIAEIPFFVIFGNSMLANIGPKIKLRLNILGDITSNIETEVKPYGINNAYVEMRVSLTVTARIILPFVSEKVVISNLIPLSVNIVQGSVPNGYIYSYK